MKKLTVIAVLFFATVYGFSQPQLIRTLYQKNITAWFGTFDSTAWTDSFDFNYTYYPNNLRATEDHNYVSPVASAHFYLDSNFYNSNKELTSTKKYLWDTTTKNWKTTSYNEIKYFYNGSLLEKIEYREPTYTDEDSFVYNFSKLLKFKYRFRKNGTNKNYIRKEEYQYNSKGLKETVIIQKIYNGSWVNSRRELYTYNTSGNIVELVYEHYNTTTSMWNKGGSYDYSYNGKGEVSKKVHRSGNGQAYDCVVYVYNPNGTLKYEYFEKGYRAAYFYKNSTTGLTEITNNKFKIYPNPTSGKFTVELESNTLSTISITDVMGKQVFTSKVSDNLDVDVSHLAKGFYFVNVRNTNGVTTQKIVLQ